VSCALCVPCPRVYPHPRDLRQDAPESDSLRAKLASLVPGDAKGRTYAEAVTDMLAQRALKETFELWRNWLTEQREDPERVIRTLRQIRGSNI